jgi:hypothetical protein
MKGHSIIVTLGVIVAGALVLQIGWQHQLTTKARLVNGARAGSKTGYDRRSHVRGLNPGAQPRDRPQRAASRERGVLMPDTIGLIVERYPPPGWSGPNYRVRSCSSGFGI